MVIIIYRQEIFQILQQHLGIVQDQLSQKTNFWLSICHIERLASMRKVQSQ